MERRSWTRGMPKGGAWVGPMAGRSGRYGMMMTRVPIGTSG